MVVLFAIASYRVLTHTDLSAISRAIEAGLKTVGCLVCILVGNAYLVLPLLITRGQYFAALSSNNPAYAFSFTFDNIETLPNSIRLITNWAVVSRFAPPWAGSYLNDPWSSLLLFTLPILAFGAALFIRRLLDIVLYGMMLIAVLLSTASNPPGGQVFTSAIIAQPALRPFYNGEIFSPIVLLFYSAFAAFTIHRLATLAFSGEGLLPCSGSWWRSSARFANPHSARAASRVWAIFVVCTLTTVLLISVYPALLPSDAVGSSYAPSFSSLPGYYSSANQYLESSGRSNAVMVFSGDLAVRHEQCEQFYVVQWG